MSRVFRSKRVPSLRGLACLCALLAGGLVADAALAQTDHLVLSKVLVKARPNPGFGSEYVAITNPTAATVDLSAYHLADVMQVGNGYWELVLGHGWGGGGSQGDFNARFPDGAQLAAGQTVVVAFEGSTLFQSQFGILPDYELFEDGGLPDGVPELVETHPGSIGIGLGNTGSNAAPSTGWLDDEESLVLYHWDGVSDLVQDVDYLTWGGENERVDKTGRVADGPDADEDTSAYLNDTPRASQSPMTVGTFQEANVRSDDAETGETGAGGNGLTGHDETSEPLATTWIIDADLTPPVDGGERLATPVLTAAALAADAYENQDATVDIALAAPAENGPDEMVVTYRVDEGAWTQVGAYDQGGGAWQAVIPGQLRDAVVDWWVSVAGEEEGGDVWPSAAPMYYESYTVLAPVDPGDGPAHLLISEVCVQGTDSEFIEIFNPTDEAVDLSDFYLTDAVYNDQGYWRLPAGNPSQSTVGGGDYYDFNGRFPDGLTIQPGQALTVSLAGASAFNTAWGVAPDLDLRADFRELFSGSLHNADGTNATLSNSAEIVVLYYWDGVSDLVTDVDMFMWGESSSARVFRNGVSIGSSTYMDDTPISSQDAFTAAHEILGSFQRLDAAETGESTTGGNGSLAHDETSEPLNTTWQAGDGTPGFFGVIELAVTGATLTPNRPQPDEDAVVTVNVTGEAEVASVTLHWAVDGGAYSDVACTDGGGAWSGTIPGQAEDAEVSWYVTVAGTGGESAVWPEGAPGTVESYTVQVFVPGEGLARLLLSEIATLGSTAEFIEIHNPNAFDVELKNYYLTDAVYYEDQAYWNLPAGSPSQATIGGGDFYDFHAQFPVDAVLPAGESITVSVAGSNAFGEVFPGLLPHYELFEDGDYSDGVTDMLEVFPGSIDGNQTPGLTNLSDTGTYINGEIVALYFWDGVSDLVTDIDIFIWGEGNSYSASKGGRTIGSSTYATEAAYPDPFLLEHAHLESYQRVDYDEGSETQSGGNGYDGADETSENLSETWTVGNADPAAYEPPEGSAEVTLTVPAATFMPRMNERFPIEFTTEPGTEVILRILDQEGRVVRLLHDSRFDGSVSTVTEFPSIAIWDGRNESFELVRAGLYHVHLLATDTQSGDRTEKTAPAVVATRLGN